MAGTRYSLGVFGDARLEKRGPSFWAGWCVGEASAFVGWPEGGVERSSPTIGSFRTRR
jgi:hypothetical protein